MGSKFVEGRSVEFSKSYEESSPSTPIFFILSPGVDPLKDVESLGECRGPVRSSVARRLRPRPLGWLAGTGEASPCLGIAVGGEMVQPLQDQTAAP